MAARWYQSGLQKIWNGTVGDLSSADIRALLLTSGYTFVPEHDFVSNLTNELSGGGYARIVVQSKTVTVDDTNDGGTWDAADPTFPSLGAAAGTPAWIVFYLHVGADSSNILLCALALPGTAPDGNNYVCTLQADGIGYIRNVAGEGLAYNNGIVDIMKNAVDVLTDTLSCSLHTSSYTADADHDTDSNLTNELSGGNYAEQTLSGKSVNLDDTNDGTYMDASDPVFTSLGAAAGSPTQMVVKSTSPDRLLFRLPLTGPDTPNGNNYVIVLAASPDGLARIRNSAS